MNKNIQQIIDKIFSEKLQNELISLRHSLHSEPELSYKEFNTQKKLLKALEECHVIQIDTVGTGIIARIKGQDSSLDPVAIRGDMDALPIKEATGLPYQSSINGVMHACGHDVHSTWAIGAARLLSEVPAPSDVLIICQPAEEVASGAKILLDSGKIPSNIKAIFAGHVDRRYSLGEVVVHDGAISSFSDQFIITIQGKSAHAARPEEGQSPIPFLVDCCQRINHIASSIHNRSMNLITITMVDSGVGSHNIIPETASIKGTIRCLSSSVRQQFHHQLHDLKNLDGVEINVDILEGSPAVINSATLKPFVTKSIQSVLGKDAIIPLIKPNLASEDFGCFLRKFPGWFFRFGARYSNDKFIPVHTPYFYAEDETIFVGAAVLSECARQC